MKTATARKLKSPTPRRPARRSEYIDVAHDSAIVDLVCLDSVAEYLDSKHARERYNEKTLRPLKYTIARLATTLALDIEGEPTGKPAHGEPTWKVERLSVHAAGTVTMARELLMETFSDRHRAPGCFAVLGTRRTIERLQGILDYYFWTGATKIEAEMFREDFPDPEVADSKPVKRGKR